MIEGGGEDDALLTRLNDPRQLQTAEVGHLDVEEEQLHVGLLVQGAQGSHGTFVAAHQVQKWRLLDEGAHQAQGQRLIIDSNAVDYDGSRFRLRHTSYSPVAVCGLMVSWWRSG